MLYGANVVIFEGILAFFNKEIRDVSNVVGFLIIQ
jgi:uridine kinase